MSNKRRRFKPAMVRCACGRTVAVGPKGYMVPHMTPGGLACFHRNVPPQHNPKQ